jgi:type IV pilus assembly protein PilF
VTGRATRRRYGRAGALVTLCLTALAGGCITTTEGSSGAEESPTEAASYNVQLGATYLSQGRLELAKDKLDKALEQDDELAIAHTYSGLLYDRLDDPEKAAYHFRRSLRLDPDDPVALNLYGAFLCRQGDAESAEEYFVAATKDPLYRTPAAAFTNAGVCLQRVGEYDRAEAYFRRALEVDPRYPDALWQMARLSQTQGPALQARAFFQRYLEVGELSAPVLYLGVRIERSLGDRQRAARYAERLLEGFPDSVEARELLESGWTGST